MAEYVLNRCCLRTCTASLIADIGKCKMGIQILCSSLATGIINMHLVFCYVYIRGIIVLMAFYITFLVHTLPSKMALLFYITFLVHTLPNKTALPNISIDIWSFNIINCMPMRNLLTSFWLFSDQPDYNFEQLESSCWLNLRPYNNC
jgi:hypothetical protein